MLKNNFIKNYLNVGKYKYLNFIDFYQKEYLPKMYLLKKRGKIPFNEQYETKDMKLKNYTKNDYNRNNNIKIINNNDMNKRKIPYIAQHESRDFGKQKFIDIVKKHI